MKFDEFSRRDLEFQLFKLVNEVVPEITKLKTPTKVHYEKMQKLAEMTERVLKGEFPRLKALSSELKQPVRIRTRLAKSLRVVVSVYFSSRVLTVDVIRDPTAESRKRPIDDTTPYMILNGARDYIGEANARSILRNPERLEKLRMLNAGRLERYEVVMIQNGVVVLKPVWSKGSPVFFRVNAKERVGQLFSVDVVNGKLWKYDPSVRGYECDKYVLVSGRMVKPEEIPLSLKKVLLAELA